MKQYWLFLRGNFGPVSFAWLLKFFSGYGQTFLVSIYVPFILADFGFSRTLFGFLYSGATLAASLLLLPIGHVIDHRPVRPFTRHVVILLAGASLLLAVARHPFFLLLGLAFLRLAGQSLLPHVGSTILTRRYDRDRGKALSISSLGFSASEMVFPLLLGPALVLAGWRWTMAGSALLLPAILLPLLGRLDLESLDAPGAAAGEGTGPAATLSLPAIVLRGRFWVVGAPTAFLSFTITGFFFYQYLLAGERGWSLGWYATCFAGFGLFKLLSSLYGGVLVDRFSARRVFPVFPVPGLVGFLVLAALPGQAAPMIFLALLGMAIGLSGVTTSAVIAELYGLEHIARVRSVFTVLMVVSAAIGPVVYGFYLDAGGSFVTIALVNALCLAALVAGNGRVRRLA